MKLTEKAAYVKGLMEGLALDQNDKEGKVLTAMLDLLEDMALTISDLEESSDEMSELLDILDEDLGDVEEAVFGDEDDACGCGCDDDDFDDDEGVYEVVCPTCGNTICIGEGMLAKGEMLCPNCGEELEFDLEGLEDPDDADADDSEE